MKRLYIILMLMLALPFTVPAQTYQAPEVERSKDRVKVDGKAYYAHVVTEKQTLFSICKAYGVSVDTIYEANEALNLRTEGLKAGQTLLIPVKSADEEPEAIEIQEDADTTDSSSKDHRSLFPQLRDIFEKVLGKTESFSLDIPDVINVAILLPFDANGKADDKSLDFYAGALLAARDLGKQGIKLNITAEDVASTAPGAKLLEQSDVIIGPISAADIKKTASRCGEGKYIVSPLEPKVASLVDSLQIVQTPTPTAAQDADLVKWALEDLRHGDNLVLVTQTGGNPGSEGRAIIDALNASGQKYEQITCGIARNAQTPLFAAHASKDGTTRFIIASESESFVNDVVRNIALLTYKNHDVALYAPSRIRSYNSIESENLHKANTHVVANYYIDYGNPDVKRFVLAYRSLFGGEPNSFAFHGYDTMHYFSGICHKYGRMWDMKLDEYSEKGLQTDFRFDSDKSDARENTAVRRIVYSPDFKTHLE